jgi:LacI family transcriptional regulator
MKKMPKVLLLLENSRKFGRSLMRGTAKYARLHGPWSFHTQPAFYLKNPDNNKKLISMIKDVNPDGIISRQVPQIQEIIKLGIPIVMSSYTHKLVPGVVNIIGDTEADGRMAAEHFLERGFKNYAYCGFSDNLWWSKARGEGFAKTIEKAGFKVHFYKQPQTNSKLTWAKEQSILANWLKSLPKPIGLMACIDERSAHVVEACKMVGLNIPEEVAVIGVDNDDLICDLSTPQLSSIALNDEMTGYNAAEVLDKLMAGEKITNQIITLSPTHAVTRRSTDTLAIDDHYVAKAIRFIRDHATEQIQVDDVVNSVAFTRRTLQRRFHSVLGRTISSEIMHARVDLACKMLVETNQPISQIALNLGQADVNHISRWFKKLKGMTPLAYRKQYSQQ